MNGLDLAISPDNPQIEEKGKRRKEKEIR